MTVVYCQSEDCTWNNCGACCRAEIYHDDNNECDCYESIYDNAEWQKPYWKRMIDGETKQIFRVLFKGKEIEICGRKFFVDNNSDYAIATDKITGYGCGQRYALEDRIERIIEQASNQDIPPLESLPIGEFDEKTRRITPKITEKGGEAE